MPHFLNSDLDFTGLSLVPFDKSWHILCAVSARNAKEVAGMRAACKISRQILDAAHAAIRPGVTTDEIDQVVSATYKNRWQHATALAM